MLEVLKIRIKHGRQYIPDVRKAALGELFRGLPRINKTEAGDDFTADKTCPSGAISRKPLSIDMGKCIFCGDCVRSCKNGEIEYTNFHRIAADSREKLIITKGAESVSYEKEAIKCRKEIKNIFGRSLKLRQVSAGGCNGCELELNACSNPNFDMGRFGIEFAASPRHADGIVITGPVTENMEHALTETYRAVPEPKIVILTGSCAISGGLFAGSEAVKRDFMKKTKIDLFVPGCPVHPLTFVNGVLRVIGR